jgi:type IV secretion system protein VirB5
MDKKLKLSLASVVFFISQAQAQGIPTFDASTFTQLATQIQQTQNLLQNAQNQLEAITGNDNIGRLLYDSVLIDYIPASGDWSEIFESDLSPLLEKYGLESENPKMQAIYEREVAVMVAAESSYKAQSQRLANIEALMDRANAVDNPQQREDLANAIAIENAAIQLEQNRMMALQQSVEQDRNLQEQQATQDLRYFFGRE